MKFDGVQIYNEGVGIESDCEEKIRQMVAAIRSMAPSSEVSMRFLKDGQTYEGLVWGKANNIPIGLYSRGHSMAHVLDTILRKVNKECLKARKISAAGSNPGRKGRSDSPRPLALAG